MAASVDTMSISTTALTMDLPAAEGSHVEVVAPTLIGAGRYVKGRVIAQTIYGSTRYGTDMVTDEQVVIKECSVANVDARRAVNGMHVAEDVYMEIELHRSLCPEMESCPYIVDFKAVCQDAEFIYIILEYAGGSELFSLGLARVKEICCLWRTNRKASVEKLESWQNNVRKYMWQLFTALQFMHARNICHRDISLSNIVLTEENDIRVIDFGVAHKYEDSFMTERSPIGKIMYMSPECHSGNYYDGRSNDVWCAGVCLWTCLVGNDPWEFAGLGDRRFELIMRGKSGIKRLLELWKRAYLVPDAAVDLLSKIFRPQNDRISVREALNHSFFAGNTF